MSQPPSDPLEYLNDVYVAANLLRAVIFDFLRPGRPDQRSLADILNQPKDFRDSVESFVVNELRDREPLKSGLTLIAANGRPSSGQPPQEQEQDLIEALSVRGLALLVVVADVLYPLGQDEASLTLPPRFFVAGAAAPLRLYADGPHFDVKEFLEYVDLINRTTGLPDG